MVFLMMLRQWVGPGGELDHFLILIELKGKGNKSGSPFKFYSECIKNEYFQEIVKIMWIAYDSKNTIPVAPQFVADIKKLKQATMEWAKRKK